MPPSSAPAGWSRARISPSKLVAIEPPDDVVLEVAGTTEEVEEGVMVVPAEESEVAVPVPLDEGPTFEMPARPSLLSSHHTSQPSSATQSEIEEIVVSARLETPSLSSRSSSPFAELMPVDSPLQSSRAASPTRVASPFQVASPPQFASSVQVASLETGSPLKLYAYQFSLGLSIY